MYLNKLEIHGFKSFGDAVKLNIPEGITAVIGPNGSGKSNVADAIRWVLGEQSAKTLRGTKMEDIIFAGTEKRKSLGYAEVMMSITNEERLLPIDYSEVKIKRRVYRSGESEYFINNSQCRLKDIHELFMDTGVGKEGYSIIGQGQIDKILSSKPEDRRSLFEEAAGIYKYKVRRHEAERKLEKERENLVRIDDIMNEIESRLEPLEKEADKTRDYLKVKDSLRDYEINVFIHEVNRIKESLVTLEQTSKDVSAQYETVKKHKSDSEHIYEQLKVERENLFGNLEQILQSISGLEKQIQQKGSDIRLNEERIKNIDNLDQEIQKDTQKQESYKEEIQSQKQLLYSKQTALEIERKTQETFIKEKEEVLALQELKIKEITDTVENSKTGLFDKMRHIEGVKSQVANQKTVEEQLEYREEQLKETIQRLNSEVSHQEVQQRLLQKKSTENREDYATQSIAFEVKQGEKEELSQDIEKTKQDLTELTEKQTQVQRQIKWLEQIKNDHEGYFQSVKQVLQVKNKQLNQWTGIIGVLAELIEVPQKYEVAMVTALGGAMQNIVTETEADAKAMIQTMKQQGIGRVTFMPLDTVQGHGQLQDLIRLREEKGFLGLGNELVIFEARYEQVMKNLLGRILVVDTLEHASIIARKYGYKYKIVTLEGEVFNAGGSLSGGSVKNSKNNIFARSRELRELRESEVLFVEKLAHLSPQVEKLILKHQQVHQEWVKYGEQVEELEEAYKQMELELAKCTSTLQLTKSTQLQMVEEKIKLQEMKEKLESDKVKFSQEIETLQEEVTKDQKGLEVLEGQVQTFRNEQEIVRNQLTEWKIECSKTIEHIRHIKEQIQLTEDKIEETKEQEMTIVSRQEELKKDKEKLLETIERLKQEKIGCEQQCENSRLQKEQFEIEKNVVEEKDHQIQVRIKELEENSQKVNEELYRLQHKKELLELENTKYSEEIWGQYELSYTGCLPFQKELGDLAVMRKEAEQLRMQIKTIGSINVNAIAEYDETKERYEFLSTQREDIQKAEKTLLEMIDQLTAQMHEIFREQFQLIATNFSQVFKELFGGGVAFLQLVDEDNILESGIEIVAKPPGKKLQNMTLLSGGERTLTAIALLFGILQLKPSPFCILDEIEAALDDANVIRFAQYLGSLSDQTQFIIITHRKGTMECADTLYGVTMQERGVSTILSIKLEEATQYLDKKLN